MPNVSEYDNESDWMEACVPTRVDEGDDKDQAVAACLSMWRERKSADPDALVFYGGAVKALGNGKVGGYLVRFTNADEPDLDGEYFDGKTWYGDATSADVYYNHGLDTKLGRRVLGKGSLDLQDAGVWIEAQLELRDQYEKAVYRLAETGKLGWSSGTAPHLVEREGNHIMRWPLGLDASLTPTPADPGNRALPLKAWAKSVDLETLPEMEPSEGAIGGVTIKAGTVNVTITATGTETPTTEVKNMAENENTTPQAPPVDVAAIARASADAAVKAYQEALAAQLAAEPPVKNPGVVVEDSADRALKGNPFSLGKFLQAVADAETPGRIDERLLPLRATDSDMKGYFNMSLALPQVVGSPADAVKSRKAPTGLGELIPQDGGFLVGTDRQASIIERMYDVGSLLSRATMFSISANSNGMTFYRSAESSRANGSRRGGILYYWAAEAAEKTASHPTFEELELKLHKIVGLVYATDELLADAAALEGWILRYLPEELRFGVEDAMIRGTGAGMPLGILNSGCLVTQGAEVGQAADTIVAENVINMWSRRWLGGRNYIWIVSQDSEPQLHQMGLAAGLGGALVYMPPGGLSGAPYGSLYGRPVIVSEYADTVGDVGDIILADMGEYLMIDKGGMQSASSIHVRFVNDETVFRFVYRVDGQPAWSTALTPYLSTNTVSPFVALAAR